MRKLSSLSPQHTAPTGYLAAYASEMFDNLFKFANSLNERISDINGRTARLMTQIPSVESTITGSSFKLEMGTAKLDRGEDQPQTQLFLPDSKPTAIRARYESPEVFRTPALKEVNAVLLPATLAEHGPCEAKFSNPGTRVQCTLRALQLTATQISL
jgi:hypothetical protein